MFKLAVFVASALVANAADGTTITGDAVCKCPASNTDSIDTLDTCLTAAYADKCTDKASFTATEVQTLAKAADPIKMTLPTTGFAVLQTIAFNAAKTAPTCANITIKDSGKGSIAADLAKGSSDTEKIATIKADDYATLKGDVTITCTDAKGVIFAEDASTVTATYKYERSADSPTVIPANDSTTASGASFNVGMISLFGAAAVYAAL